MGCEDCVGAVFFQLTLITISLPTHVCRLSLHPRPSLQVLPSPGNIRPTLSHRTRQLPSQLCDSTATEEEQGRPGACRAVEASHHLRPATETDGRDGGGRDQGDVYKYEGDMDGKV